jgi:hypothetical protein
VTLLPYNMVDLYALIIIVRMAMVSLSDKLNSFFEIC